MSTAASSAVALFRTRAACGRQVPEIRSWKSAVRCITFGYVSSPGNQWFNRNELFCLEPQLAEVGVRDGSAQLMVTLAPVERLLDIAPERRRVNVVQQVQAAEDVVIFPQGAPRLVFSRKGTQLAHDGALRGSLQGQRHQNPLNIFPLLDDKLRAEFTDGLEHHVLLILAWVSEAVEGFADLVINIPVAWRELIAKHIEDGEVDLVGAVCIRRMDFGL